MASKDASKSVMGNLPNTRPARIGGRRERTDRAAAAKPATTGAMPKTGSKPRAVRSGSPALKAAKDKKAASAPQSKPQSRPTPRSKSQPASPPKGTELVTTAVQAAGELAQIGLTLGGQAVKRAVRRLPKP